jgi:predicted RND superfamily exporter protein
VLGITGITKLQIEMDISELWGPDHPVTRAIDFVSEHLQRADRLEIELALPAGATLEDPATLRSLATLEDELGALEGMGRSQSLVTILRHTNHLLRPGAEGTAGLPDSEAGVAELIFLVSAGASGALDAWLTLDQRHTRVSFEVQDLSMREREDLLAQVEHHLQATLPAGWSYAVTGPVALMSRYGAEFSRSQTNIVSASSLLVFAMIGVYLRSLPWALLAMIPNAIALVLLFGAMGHGGILLNFGSAIVAPIAIGIAADDTIHFLTAYSRERRSGKEPIAALHGAISGVGEAVIATAIALSLGFLSMIASPMASIASLGLVSAIAIVGATLADLLVLPALIATVATSRSLGPAPRAASIPGADRPLHRSDVF